MRMPLFLRLLKHKRGNWISFVGVYALGLSVFLVVDGLSRNFQRDIQGKSKELLEAELRVQSRRALTPREDSALAAALPAGTRRAEVWGFLSMLRVKPKTPAGKPRSSDAGNSGNLSVTVSAEPGSLGNLEVTEGADDRPAHGVDVKPVGDGGNPHAAGTEVAAPAAAVAAAASEKSAVRRGMRGPAYSDSEMQTTMKNGHDAGPAASADPAASATAAPAALSRLVQVKAVSETYPLLGGFTFADSSGAKKSGGPGDGEIWFPGELLAALHAAVGDSVQLGSRAFRIAREYRERPGGNLDFWEMGSRVYIPLGNLAATGLEGKGSRIFRYRFYMFPAGVDVRAVKAKAEAALADPEIETEAYTDSASDLGRSFDMVTAFLKMLSLSAFLLSAVGAAFFFRHHLAGEGKTVAVLRTLGASRGEVMRVYAAQNLALSLLSAVIGFALARLWSLGLPVLIARLYGIQVPASLPLATFLLGLALAVSASLLFGLTGFLGLGRVSPASLLKPAEAANLGWGWRTGLFAAQGAFFFLLALWDSRAWMLSALSVGSMGVSFLLLAGLGWVIFKVLWMLRSHMGYSLRVALGTVRWGREKSLLAFTALGFVAFSFSLLPQLQSLILGEISVPQGRVLPQLFLFDIQEEQLAGVESLIRSRGRELQRPAPMIRARLARVNGVAFKRDSGDTASLEQRNRRQFRNRGFNLSYRDSLSDAEKLAAGKFWSGPAEPGALPMLSVEKQFAQRLNLKLGDSLVFDVQGVEIAGRVASMRTVRWASFQPNFFVLFQPGALEDAPKTFLGTVPAMPIDQAQSLQDGLSAAFPNVTVLNLKDVIDKTTAMLGKLAWLVRFLSAFALLIGLAILWLVVDSLVSESARTVMLMRSLGESRGRLARMFLKQYVGFCLAAGLAGYTVGLAAAWVIDAVVWQVPWIPDLRILGACVCGAVLVGVFCAAYAAYKGAGKPLRELLAITRG